MRRLALVVLIALAGAADARADAIRMGPVTVHGWHFEGLAVGAGGPGGGIDFTVRRGAAQPPRVVALGGTAAVRRHSAFGEEHFYSGQGTHRVTTSPTAIRGAFGRDTRIRMRFEAIGAVRRLPVDAGCHGRGERVQPGRLVGSLRLVTGLRGVGTLRFRSLPAAREIPSPGETCPAAPHARIRLQSRVPPARRANVAVQRTARETDASVVLYRNSTRHHPMAVTHRLLGFLPPSALTKASDGTIRFTGSGPFVRTTTYSPVPVAGDAAPGRLTGPLSARFRGLGPITVVGTGSIPAADRWSLG